MSTTLPGAGSIIYTGQASTVIATVAQQANFTTQSTLNAYKYKGEVNFTTQSTLNAYKYKGEVNFTTQSQLLAYQVYECDFTTQSTLSAYTAKQAEFIGQSALNSFANTYASFNGQSAMQAYQAYIGKYQAQSVLNAYQVYQSQFIAQSELNIYSAFLGIFDSQSSLWVYEGSQAAFNAQSALNASEQFYGWTINLTTGAISKYENFNFNSLSGAIGSDSTGIFDLFGNSDNGIPIAGFVESGKLDFKSSSLKRVSDAYVSMKGGKVELTVTTENVSAGYSLLNTTQLKNVKKDLSRKAKGRYWQFKLENVAGSQARIDDIEILVQPLSRKV